MSTIQTKIATDTWVTATWDEYIQAMENPDYEKAKFYYFQGKLRIEMSPLGFNHASDHSIINSAINIYAALKGIKLNGQDNCTYRKIGNQGVQPDLSYYIGENVKAISYDTSIIDLDLSPPPNLVIEIANTSLPDDQGTKRLLYEDLKVEEYWIVDVQKAQIMAFKIENGGSFRIRTSQVLANLEISLLEEALRRTRETYHSEVGAWLIKQFQD